MMRDYFSEGVTRERFNRGPVRDSPGFPLQACGNDGITEKSSHVDLFCVNLHPGFRAAEV